MRQVGLILWKDVRELRWQLGAYALLLAAFAWVSPQTWPGNAPDSFLAVFVTLLKILLMASQFVLITSAIHADRLVGEEQFWITHGHTTGNPCWRPNFCSCSHALFCPTC